MTTTVLHDAIVLPGDHIAPAVLNPKPNQAQPSPGNGLHVTNTAFHSSLAGTLTNVSSSLFVSPTTIRPTLPYVDATVLARVTRITPRQAHVVILAVDAIPCAAPSYSTSVEEGFGGIIRQQDIRATEKDRVVVAESFGVGDVVRASVISIGDERNYYLSTAKNELGVVMAKGDEGVMYPVNWKEVVGVRGREGRKVARPEV